MTSNVPRATIKPRDRVVSLPSSSGHTGQSDRTRLQSQALASHSLLDVVQDKIHQLVVAFEGADNFSLVQKPSGLAMKGE